MLLIIEGTRIVDSNCECEWIFGFKIIKVAEQQKL